MAAWCAQRGPLRPGPGAGLKARHDGRGGENLAPFLGSPLRRPCCSSESCPAPSHLRPSATATDATAPPTRRWEEGRAAWAAAPTTEAEFRAAVRGAPPGTLTLVDFYATWCAGCAKVYPVLLELAADPDLAGRVSFVKVCNDRLGALSRAEGAAALPHIGLYGPGGSRLLDFQARPSRLHLLKGNLLRMLDGEGAPAPPEGRAWALDADGMVTLVDAAARAAAAVEAAAAVADLASTASLSERLMAMAGGGNGGGASTSTSSLGDRLARLAGGGPPSSSSRHTPSPAEAAFRAHPVYGTMYNPRADATFDAEIAPRMPAGHHYLDYTGAEKKRRLP